MQVPTLRQLEYLIAVAETGSFSKAARVCGVSQPSLSKQVQEVEALLEVTIFERARPRALVTPQGAPLVAQARRVLAEAQHLAALARTQGDPLSGRLVLGAIPTIAPSFLPGLLVRLRRAHPELMCVIEELQTDPLLAALRDGSVELGLLALPVPDQGLSGEAVFDEPFVLAAPKGHALARPEPATLSALRGADLLLMDDGHCFRDHALEVCAVAQAGVQAEVRAASISTLLRLVESGVGATLIPAMSLLHEQIDPEWVVLRSFTSPQPRRTIGLRWRSTSPRAEEMSSLVLRLREHAVELQRQLSREIHGPPLALTLHPDA